MFAACDPVMAQGLSPRMRGNRRLQRTRYAGMGSIPAHAGEPVCVPVGTGRNRVYPRACGGTEWRDQKGGKVYGLSPRMRGNHPKRPRSA